MMVTLKCMKLVEEARLPTYATEGAAAWGRIQREAPDLAELLGAVRGAFGKPAAVRVTINGERVV